VGVGNGSLMVDMQTKVYRRAKGKGVAVLNHKLTKVLRLSTSNPVASRKPDTQSQHQKLAAGVLVNDNEVKGKPLQLGRTYHRRRTLRKTKTAGKMMGTHPGKYVICETVCNHSVV